jgi:hypothetical protein
MSFCLEVTRVARDISAAITVGTPPSFFTLCPFVHQKLALASTVGTLKPVFLWVIARPVNVDSLAHRRPPSPLGFW